MSKTENKSSIIKITFSADEFLLKGTLHLPSADKPPVVIGSHGLFSSSDSPKQIELARQCSANNIAFFRFDHRGCGESKGVFGDVTSLNARCNDLASAIKTILDRNDTGDRIALFGSSMGGAVCLSVLNRSDIKKLIDSIVVFAAPIKSSSIINVLEKPGDSNMPELITELITEQAFDKNSLKFDVSDMLSGIQNILIFHGDSDTVVPPSQGREIYRKAGKPKKLIIQRHGDHLMSDTAHQEKFIEEAVAWFKIGFETFYKTV